MQIVPALIFAAILTAIVTAVIAILMFWDRNPEQAQAMVIRGARSVWEAILVVYRIVRWPVTLVIAVVTVTGMFVVWYLSALAWVFLSRVAGEQATVNIQLS